MIIQLAASLLSFWPQNEELPPLSPPSPPPLPPPQNKGWSSTRRPKDAIFSIFEMGEGITDNHFVQDLSVEWY